MTTQWNKYPDTYPDACENVLIFNGREIRIGYLSIRGQHFTWFTESANAYLSYEAQPNITHWMPLPEFPK